MDDEDGPVYKLVKKWKVALPLRADFGTMPNVYYVLPLSPPKFNDKGEVTGEPRIPMKFLGKTFWALGCKRTRNLKKRDGEKGERRRHRVDGYPYFL